MTTVELLDSISGQLAQLDGGHLINPLTNTPYWFEQLLPNNIKVIKYFKGHSRTIGKSAGVELNSYALVKKENIDSPEDEEIFYAIHCNPSQIAFFSVEDKDKIIFRNKQENIRETWFFCAHIGYIACSRKIYMHQLVMNWIGKGKGQDSVDHINYQNKCDNRRCNLRNVSQSIQNENRGKKNRNSNAIKQIPDEVLDYLEQKTGERKLPKFVEYYKDEKDGRIIKEYFTISGNHHFFKHLSLCTVKTTQGKKKSILEKIKEIEKGLTHIDSIMENPKEEWELNREWFV